jgi:hypothetical protein
VTVGFSIPGTVNGRVISFAADERNNIGDATRVTPSPPKLMGRRSPRAIGASTAFYFTFRVPGR